jgi:hypothetical protein
MIERTNIDGRAASVAYLTDDFQPAGIETATLLKIIFDDGTVAFARNSDSDLSEAEMDELLESLGLTDED